MVDIPLTGWKRAAADKLGDLLQVRIARVNRAGPLLELDVLARFLPHFQVDCVFDVGANVGQYAHLLRRVGYSGYIISFEPIPAAVEALRKASRNDGKWLVENAALDEFERLVPFNIMKGQKFSSLRTPAHDQTKIFETANAIDETITVRTLRLEDVFDRYHSKLEFRRPYLKMDTQGNDLAVARGAGSRLGRFVGLQSELAFKKLYDGQVDYRDAIDFYVEAGFSLTALVPNNYGHFPDLIELDCIMYNRLFDS